MVKREKQDRVKKARWRRNNVRVLKYVLRHIDCCGEQPLESPDKLCLMYAGYTALRALWESETNKGKNRSGDDDLDKAMKEQSESGLKSRIDGAVMHGIGLWGDRPVLRVATFKYWLKKAANCWGQGDGSGIP